MEYAALPVQRCRDGALLLMERGAVKARSLLAIIRRLAIRRYPIWVIGGILLGMRTPVKSSCNEPEPNPAAFSEALSKLVTIPRAEMQKRIKTVPEVPVSRHSRYKYVPAVPPQKP